MTKEITIVSAYFDIGRSKMKNYKRTTQDYFDYFMKWGELKNNFVIFVEDEQVKKQILKFRKSIGLENKTKVIIIEDIVSIAPESYSNIERAMNNNILIKYRLRPKNPESNKPLYNYIMILKAWCINYVANELQIKGQLAWIDFGFNHGGSVYNLKSNFNIKWEYDFGKKITIFNLQPLNERPIFDIIFSMDTYIMGSILIVPSYLAGEFWSLTQYIIKTLSEVGVADDDQIVWLMGSRIKPELFTIKEVSGWHRALKEYGCNELILRKENKKSKIKVILGKIKYKLEIIKYLKQIYDVAKNWKQQ